jgi:hypothetical protein
MSNRYDSWGAYPGRVAVALGLARWRSGMRNGLWSELGEAPGDNNGWVNPYTEMTWLVPFGDRSLSDSADIWISYANYMKDWSSMVSANSAFRYRFGLKTFMNYLLDNRPTHAQTPEFADCPAQPMQAVKDAVNHLVGLLGTLDTEDQLSLEIYGQTARHEVGLTTEFEAVHNRLNAMQAGYYDLWTNMGGGITRAIEELHSERGRHIARKVIFLLTDGQANVSSWGATGDYYNGAQYALDEAQAAVDQGIMVFCVSVGSGADEDLMEQIAAIGGGTHFHAEGSIDAYTAQLEQIFASLGGTRPVELIK